MRPRPNQASVDARVASTQLLVRMQEARLRDEPGCGGECSQPPLSGDSRYRVTALGPTRTRTVTRPPTGRGLSGGATERAKCPGPAGT
jgi:hypothetical protein